MHQSKSIQDDGAAPGWAAAFVRGEGARYQQIVGFDRSINTPADSGLQSSGWDSRAEPSDR